MNVRALVVSDHLWKSWWLDLKFVFPIWERFNQIGSEIPCPHSKPFGGVTLWVSHEEFWINITWYFKALISCNQCKWGYIKISEYFTLNSSSVAVCAMTQPMTSTDDILSSCAILWMFLSPRTFKRVMRNWISLSLKRRGIQNVKVFPSVKRFFPSSCRLPDQS